jgi:hypothetical protein
MTTFPDFVLYAQHGWADNCRAIAEMARLLATPNALVIAPNLGFFKTWLRIEPLVWQAEQSAIDTLNRYPGTQIRIVGHSMGGLIWLEVLNRHREWWPQIHSVVLVASPIGGAGVARAIDPLGIGIGIARDLGINRRPIAERIAKVIPTLIIAGDIDRGSDGLVPVEATRCAHATFICLPGISHPALKNHLSLVAIIQDFWAHPAIAVVPEADLSTQLIRRLRLVPGMTDADRGGFDSAKVLMAFKSGISIRTEKNLLGVDRVFIANSQEDCLYSGFVGWLHTQDLWQALAEIQQRYDCWVRDS